MKIKPSEALKEITVLYVEDEEAIREVFSLLLKRYVKELFLASNGQEGLDIFKAKKPDIVISDIRMPVMDGLEMAEKIKEISPDTHIILITAFSDIDYLKRALEIGVEGYIMKPVNKTSLLKKLNFLAEAIVNKKEAEEYLHLLNLILDEQHDPVVLLEEDRIIISNRVFRDIFGEVKDMNGLKDRLLDSPECDNFSQSIGRQIICTEKDGLDMFFEVITKKAGKYVLIYFKDITEYRKETLVDELTGVYNRKYLRILEKKIMGLRICVIMCDIDNFKQINDTYGHLKGDEVLVKVAQTLKSSLRGSDVIIRYGGEEFLIYLNDVQKAEVAYSIAESLRKKINEIYYDEGKKLSCSFGVGCSYISGSDDFRYLLSKTDKALYQAKLKGKNRTEKAKMFDL
ncbi:diguanylate cyclase, partial [Persephonella sp.]